MISLQKFSRADRLLDVSWRTLTWGLISLLSIASLILVYVSLMSAFAGRWNALAPTVIGGLTLGFAVVMLCRFRTDLIGN